MAVFSQRSWPLVACYDFPWNGPPAEELRRLVNLKDRDTHGRRELELERRVCSLNSTRLDPPCTFVLRDFTAKKRNGEGWISEPFYTIPQGYKLCLSAWPNGKGDGYSTHVSVFVHLMIMWGDFDYQLEWPFRGTIALELLDMPNTFWPQNKSTVISFNQWTLLEFGSRVMNEEMNPNGPGETQFVPHWSLYRRYLTADDCLHFRVSSVTSE